MPEILLEANHIKKYYGERAVLDIDHLRVYAGERIGLIGENGAGKSTLLAILCGELEPDEGEVRLRAPAALIHQSGETRLAASRAMKTRFRAPEAREGLSGGEQTRRRIAGALSQSPALLLADEPTTDLDSAGIQRLTQSLEAHTGALILVSHDRALLNRLCGRILHLEDGHLTDFPGGYEAYQRELERRRAFQQFEYDQYRAEQARLKASAQRMAERAASVRKAPSRMGNSEARLHKREATDAVLRLSHAKRGLQNRMERLEKKERPRDLPDIRMALGQSHPIAARTALTVNLRALTAGERTLLRDARLELPTGSRTALMGENGCGKTTLLRALRGQCAPGTQMQGEVRLNPAARLAWFDQDHARTLNFDATALENAMADSSLPESVARTVLARLNMRGDDVFKPVRVLSGGERARIALARLLLGDANLLLLDEPTNHLDVFTMKALEALLAGYGGTVLFVSHDRAFVEGAATRVVRLEGGSLNAFEGGLTAMEARQNADRDREERQMRVSALEMRLAALAARLSAPRKGDRPEQLNAEYEATAEALARARAEAAQGDARR